jgi:hypothetical protein
MTSELERASALVDELETKRAQHVAKAEKLAAERDEIALGAFTGNGKQRERVDEIHTTLAKHSSELAALDSALKSARQRVADRQAAEVAAVNRQQAEEARKLIVELGEAFLWLDARLEEAARALIAIDRGFAELRQSGVGPSETQLRLGLTSVVETWAQTLPKHVHNQLRDGVRFLSPAERRTASEYWARVRASLDNQIAQVAGEPPAPPNPTKKRAA